MDCCLICKNSINNEHNDHEEVSRFGFLCYDCDNEFGRYVEEFRLLHVSIVIAEYHLHNDFDKKKLWCERLLEELRDEVCDLEPEFILMSQILLHLNHYGEDTIISHLQASKLNPEAQVFTPIKIKDTNGFDYLVNATNTHLFASPSQSDIESKLPLNNSNHLSHMTLTDDQSQLLSTLHQPCPVSIQNYRSHHESGINYKIFTQVKNSKFKRFYRQRFITRNTHIAIRYHLYNFKKKKKMKFNIMSFSYYIVKNEKSDSKRLYRQYFILKNSHTVINPHLHNFKKRKKVEFKNVSSFTHFINNEWILNMDSQMLNFNNYQLRNYKSRNKN